MNKYQAKLEAIKAKRLNWKVRFQSLVIFIAMVFFGLIILPVFGFSGIWSINEALLQITPNAWISYVTAIIFILLALFIIFLIFYSISIGLKHLVRFLSGIKQLLFSSQICIPTPEHGNEILSGRAPPKPYFRHLK